MYDDDDDYPLYDDDRMLDDYCPRCGREYDEIDYEYQICHYCKYDNS